MEERSEMESSCAASGTGTMCSGGVRGDVAATTDGDGGGGVVEALVCPDS